VGFHTIRRFWTVRAVIPPSVVVSAALALAACSGSRGNGAPAAPPPTGVKLAVVRTTQIEDTSEYLASVISMSSTLIRPEVSGEITNIYVRSGDRVAAGARLFQIDPRRQEASVSTQDAALAAQQSAARLARQDLDRAKTLFSAGAISQQQLDQAQANFDSAQSQLAAQQARLQQERVTLQYYEVRAPREGIVGDIPVRVGLHVTTDTALTTVDRNQHLEVDVQVPLERAHELRVGLPMRIVDGQGRPLGETSIFFVSPRVDEQTQSVLVKGQLESSPAVRSAQFVRARIVWQEKPGLTVPLLAVVRVNGQPFVFVAKDGGKGLVAEQRLVKLGDLVGNDVVVLGGLQPNERVVVSGVQKLANGAPIRPA
jgi:RND family efflux transporter MFP subunit